MLSQLTQKQQSLHLSISTAISFLFIDLYYTMNGTIAKIYLADAMIELIFLILASFAWSHNKKSKSKF